MATKPQAAAPAKAAGKQINRTRRNALERKCIPKSYKIQFAGAGKATFRSLLAAWKDSRKKGANQAA